MFSTKYLDINSVNFYLSFVKKINVYQPLSVPDSRLPTPDSLFPTPYCYSINRYPQ
ncbi:MAG: hypothetical protein F6K26_21025 [Moorea sp. SIO2I5]|nr:hypothetical protein [Moorena sp. SIO2I5]